MAKRTKMVMSGNLANQILDSLACLAISAMGIEGQVERWEEVGDEDIPVFKEEYTKKAMDYSIKKFNEICAEWEQEMGMAFCITPDE